MSKIKSIYGDEPRRDGEYPVAYCVGYSGITAITESTENLGDYGIHWFHVWTGDDEIARMNARYVAQVEFAKAGE
ncbi:hypothetical protein ACLMJV_20995 [Sinorhizobium meliloti]|uniref:hypothetical protein n=1 Tax=Rhizobium meliloti TaxID=382 RepID=UPI00398D199E